MRRALRQATPEIDRPIRSPRSGAWIPVLLLSLLSSLVWSSVADAIEVRVQVARGPYYVGEAFEIQVIATDLEDDPAPEISVGVHGGGSLRLLGVSPSTSSSISIINGKMTRTHEVKHIYRYEFTGTREGRVRIPEFLVTQGSESKSTRAFELEMSGVPTSNRVGISLSLPESTIFVGQKVPVAIEFRIDRQLQRDLVSYQVHVPLFEDPALRFLDEPPPEADSELEVHTSAGVMRLPAVSRETVVDGRASLILRAERTMIALSPEPITADATKVFVTRGASFRRDIFNQRRATSTEKFMAADRPVQIEVGEVPRQGRPASFAGAVGEGFTLDVTADRSVVQLGEPILLSFHLRGDGDLSSASLPPLDAEGLFDPEQFRLPEDSPPGLVDENGKHFEVTLRVLDARVEEIPALAYSWFDAETRSFETTRSRPIALSVGAAEVIGADSVTRRADIEEDALAADEAAPKGAGQRDSASDSTVRSTSLALTGANLGIERDVSRLLHKDQASTLHRPLAVGCYAAGLALLLFAAVDARRRSIDPAVAHRAQAFKRARQATEAAFRLQKEAAAAALGRALRELLAELPEESGPEFDALIAECDTLRFARGQASATQPVDGGDRLSAALQERARTLLAKRAEATPDTRHAEQM